MKNLDIFNMSFCKSILRLMLDKSSVKKVAIFLLVISFSQLASALSGVEMPSKTDPSQEVEDMKVKVLGGYVRITRVWENGHWVWNKRWSSVWVEDPLSISKTSAYKYTHYEDGKIFLEDRSGNFFTTEPWAYAYTGSNPERELIWNDRLGNKITYSRRLPNDSSYFKIKNYKNNNDVAVNINTDENMTVQAVSDHFGREVIRFEWIMKGDKRVVASITDYSGRKISYDYDNAGNLISTKDVNGYLWKYKYKWDQMYILDEVEDPEAHIFKQVSSPTSKDAKFDSKTQLSYLATTDKSGRWIETWTNLIGEISLKKVNGEVEFSREFIWNYSNATNLSGISDHFKRDNKADDQAWAVRDYCKLIGGLSGRDELDGMPRGCTNIRADLEKKETCGTGPYSICMRNWRYDEAIRLDATDPILLRNPDPANPIPYIKTMIETDGNGLKTTHEYDSKKNEIKVTNPDGTFITRTWHPKYALPLTVTNERGMITTYEYDEKGNLITLTEAKGTGDQRITRYTYDEYGQLKTETTGESAANNTALAQVSYEYDTYGNLTKITDAEGNVTTYSDYDVLGNAKTIKDARSNKLAPASQYSWKFTYDLVGNLLTSKNPYGKGFTFAYNKTGDIQSTLGIDGSPATYTTNASGAPLTVTDENGKVTKFDYDSVGNLIAVTDANGNKSQRVFGANGEISKLIDGENNITQFNYQRNQITSIQFPTYKQLFDYDAAGQVTQVTQQANGKNYLRKRSYNKTGNITGLVDANSKSVSYEYDLLGRVVKTTNATGGIIEFTYDARDNLLQVKDPENRATIYTYDRNDNLLTETKDGDQNTSRQYRYSYDENENVAGFVNPQQEKIAYEYDQADRLVKKSVFANKNDSLPIKVVDFAVNAKDQFTGWEQKIPSDLPAAEQQAADAISMSETYGYTTLGQLETVTVNFGTFTKTYSYSYYPNGLQKTYTNPEGIVYTYYYNRNNQLVAVHIPNIGQISYGDFSWFKPKTIVLPGGMRIGASLTDFLQTKDRTLKNAAQSTISSAHYEYDLENNITQLNQDGAAVNYSYDDLYRLKTVDAPDNSAANDEIFDYDGVGNRTSHKVGANTPAGLVYNNKNQLTDVGGAVYTYNTNGHTKTVTRDSVVTEYQYNHEERLVAVKRGGNLIAEYAYNPQGQRVKKTVNGAVTWFLYNGNGLAAEYGANGQLIKEYQFHPQKDWMTDPLFVRNAQNDIFYYYNDHLGTPLELLSNAGQIVWQAQYDAFGYAHILTDTVENNLRFPGQYYDAETGLHQNFYRDYDPSVGRYIESDPIGLNGGINFFGYAYQNPLKYTDPTGEIIPLAIAYARCVAQCMLADAAMNMLFPSPCYSPEHSARDCALECLNPMNWVGGGVGRGGKPNVSSMRPGQWDHMPRVSKNDPPFHPDFRPHKKRTDLSKIPWMKDRKGYEDRNGNFWEPVPDGHKGTHPPHWDVQHPDGSHTQVIPPSGGNGGGSNFAAPNGGSAKPKGKPKPNGSGNNCCE